ncbi:MAG: AsmA-like C-terminal region-containing protein, partial [Desulfobacterales bacterium]|nr:AsmA-like C-terminal region-containing protein [Desulfobacterales bacterium]
SLKSDLIEADYFSARTAVAGVLKMQESLYYLQVRIEMPEVDLKKSLEEAGDPDILEGLVSIHAEFEGRAAHFNEILKNLKGDFSIKGRNLILIGADLDRVLAEFKKMSGYGFSDFSALVLLGPLGAVVSHGYDQLESFEEIMAASGNSTIRQIVSDWNVSAGVLTATDVAFSTRQNRVAVKGGIDLDNQRFKNVIIAIVDPQGCIVNSETVSGTFKSPEIKDLSVVQRTVVRPLKRFLKTDCDFFYDGSVPHPSGQ